MNKLTLATAALVASATFGMTAAHAATVNAIVSDDRTILTDGNGNASALGVQNDVFLRTFGTSSVWRSVIEFDLAGLMAGDTVASAFLGLRDEGTSRDGRIDIYGYSADGTVSLADASELSTLVTSMTITAANGIEDFALDVTSFVQGLATSSATHAGFLLVSEDETNFGVGGSDTCSSEAGLGTANFVRPNCVGFGPSLTVETVSAVPLPAGLPLLLTGFLGLGALRRRRNRTT